MQELHLSTWQWGLVQGAALLPNLVFMLPAGAWADRYDPAKVLSFAQTLLSCAYLGLFFFLNAQLGQFSLLLVYAAVVGAGHAFIQPVREKLISELPSASLQQRVSMLSITQFAMQGLGIGVAALSEVVGLGSVILLQAGISFFSALVFWSLTRKQAVEMAEGRSTLDDIRDAFRTVSANAGLKQLLALIAFNGYMHMGVFLVLIPVVATRVYEQSASEYAGLQALFVLGMVVSHVFLLRQKLVEFPGQGALFSLLYTALVGFGLAKGPTPFGFYSLVFIWGLVAGNSAGRCRLVAQSLVEPEMRGRIMSVYQLLLFGAAPIGAMVTGLALNVLSTKEIFMVMSVSSVGLFFVFMLTRTLWSVRQSSDRDSGDESERDT